MANLSFYDAVHVQSDGVELFDRLFGVNAGNVSCIAATIASSVPHTNWSTHKTILPRSRHSNNPSDSSLWSHVALGVCHSRPRTLD